MLGCTIPAFRDGTWADHLYLGLLRFLCRIHRDDWLDASRMARSCTRPTVPPAALGYVSICELQAMAVRHSLAAFAPSSPDDFFKITPPRITTWSAIVTRLMSLC